MARFVIIGGGFGGVACAKALRHGLSLHEHEIVLFDFENHMVFHPLLAEVAGSSLQPDAAAVPLRQMLPGVFCRTERITGIDFDSRKVTFQSHRGAPDSLTYDHVVITAGGVVNMNLIPGMAEHGFPLKTIGDALLLRSHIIQQLEKAEVAPTPEQKKQSLTFLIAGGGFSGVETAGEINDFARVSTRYFHGLSPEDISVTLIHSRDYILPELSEPLRAFALRQMKKAGVQFELNTRVTSATANGVRLKDGRDLKGDTVITTIGNVPAPLVQSLNAPKIEGALETDPDLRVKGQTNVWAIGDCAWIINADDGKPCPGTAQFAERQGKQLAANLIRVLRGEATKPFSHRSQGQLCSIGGKRAVAEILGVHLSGFWAWFVWRGVYLFKMPTWSRRIKIGFDWAWDLVFFRDLIYVKPDQTARISNAYYDPDDIIFGQGDEALACFAIQAGEVEITRKDAQGVEKSIATIGPGAFFGEKALIEKRTHSATARAKTPVRVLVISRDIFAQLSGSIRKFSS